MKLHMTDIVVSRLKDCGTYFDQTTPAYQDSSGLIIRLEHLEDLFTPTNDFPLGAWPFWTYAAFPDLTEFWTPSYCDYVRELFMAQASAVNQTLDNAEAINKPMKYVDTGAIKNMAELKYRRDGIVKLKAGTDPNKAVQSQETPPIDTPLNPLHLHGLSILRGPFSLGTYRCSHMKPTQQNRILAVLQSLQTDDHQIPEEYKQQRQLRSYFSFFGIAK